MFLTFPKHIDGYSSNYSDGTHELSFTAGLQGGSPGNAAELRHFARKGQTMNDGLQISSEYNGGE